MLPIYQRLFGDRDPVVEPGTATGTPGNWWTVMALVPDVFEHATAGLLLYRSPERSLDPILRELGFDPTAIDDLCADLGGAAPVCTVVRMYLNELHGRRLALAEAVDRGDLAAAKEPPKASTPASSKRVTPPKGGSTPSKGKPTPSNRPKPSSGKSRHPKPPRP